jgi:hypothetical protein
VSLTTERVRGRQLGGNFGRVANAPDGVRTGRYVTRLWRLTEGVR